jgi:glutaredoxin-like protein NrdH
MKVNHVSGKNKGHILLYALSTCGWCMKTKQMLKDLGVEYDYIDVDLLDEDEKSKVIEQVRKWNPRSSFPTIVLNNNKCVVGYQPEVLQKDLT